MNFIGIPLGLPLATRRRMKSQVKLRNFNFEQLDGRSIEFEFPNEAGNQVWGRGSLELNNESKGRFEVMIITARGWSGIKEILIIRSLKQVAVDKIILNPRPVFADFRLTIRQGKWDKYWQEC